MAFEAQLKPGRSADAVRLSGLRVASLVKSDANSTASAIVIGLWHTDGTQVGLATLRAVGDLEAVGALLAQSGRAELRSCAYQLSDSQGASVVRDVAKAALAKAGLLSANELDADSTIWTVSDDPIHTGGLVVCAQVMGDRLNATTESDGLFGLKRYVVVLDTKQSVDAVGPADW